MVYSDDTKKSFSSMNEWKKIVINNSPNIPFLICANKVDKYFEPDREFMDSFCIENDFIGW